MDERSHSNVSCLLCLPCFPSASKPTSSLQLHHSSMMLALMLKRPRHSKFIRMRHSRGAGALGATSCADELGNVPACEEKALASTQSSCFTYDASSASKANTARVAGALQASTAHQQRYIVTHAPFSAQAGGRPLRAAFNRVHAEGRVGSLRQPVERTSVTWKVETFF